MGGGWLFNVTKPYVFTSQFLIVSPLPKRPGIGNPIFLDNYISKEKIPGP